MSGKANMWGVLLLIGGIMAAAAIFLDWHEFLGLGSPITGWDIFTEGKESDYEYYMLPLVLLASAAVAVVISAVELVRSSKALGVLTLIIGILVIALPIFLLSDLYGELSVFGYNWIDDVAMGFYLMMTAGVLLLIGSIATIVKSN